MNRLEKFISKNITAKIFTRQENHLVANNTFWIMADRLLRISMGLVTGVLVARYLGPEAAGKLNYVMVMLAIFYPIYTLTLDNIIVRDLSMETQKPQIVFGTVLVLRITFALLCFIAYNTLIVTLNPTDTTILYLGFILSFSIFFQVAEFIEPIFQWHLKSKYAMYVKSLVFFICSVIKLIMVYTKMDLLAFGAIYLIEIAAGATIVYLVASKKYPNYLVQLKPKRQYLKNLIRKLPNTIASALFLQLILKIDQIILKLFSTASVFGQYSVAMRMIEYSTFIPVAIIQSYLPILSKSFKQDKLLFESKIQNLFHVIFYIGVGLSLLVFFLGNSIFGMLFGIKFHTAGSIFALASYKILLIYIISVCGTYYVVIEKLKKYIQLLVFISLLIFIVSVIGAYVANWKGILFAQLITVSISVFLVFILNSKNELVNFWIKSMHPFLFVNKKI